MSEPEGLGGAAPWAGAQYFRAHGLGNDYLVFGPPTDEADGWSVTPTAVRQVCDRHVGVGGDGIVVLTDVGPEDGVFPVRMFNPDGSAFERSGNGLRILAAYLTRGRLVGAGPFRVRTGGDVVRMVVHAAGDDGRFDVSVEMGRARVGPDAVAADPTRLDDQGRAVHPSRGPVTFVPVSVGNPHAVIFLDRSSDQLLSELGPFLSTHSAFPQGTNVQLATVAAPGRLRIRIWERGVGRTSASGTSSCAAAAAAVFTGRLACGPIIVEMDGGALQVGVGPDLDLELRGPVAEISEGRLTPGFRRRLAEEVVNGLLGSDPLQENQAGA